MSEVKRVHYVTAHLGTARRIVMELGHAEAIKQAVRVGVGAAFLFAQSTPAQLAGGKLSALDVAGLQLNFGFYSVFRTDRKLSPLQQTRLDCLSKHLKQQSFCIMLVVVLAAMSFGIPVSGIIPHFSAELETGLQTSRPVRGTPSVSR